MHKFLIAAAGAVFVTAMPAKAVTLVSADFEGPATVYSGVSVAISAPGGAAVSADLLPAARWGTTVVRNTTNALVTLTLGGVPNLSAFNVAFDFLFIDSWDSTNGSPAPDFVDVTVNGTLVGQLTAANQSGSVNNYLGGTLIFSGINVIGNPGFVDRGAAISLPFGASTSGTITVGLQATGAGFQFGDDESWGADNFVVTGTLAVPEPASWALFITGFGLVGAALRRRTGALSKTG